MIAFNELKAVAKVLQEAGKIEQYQQILDAQKELLEMQNKIVNLETDNKRLRDEFEIKENLISEGNLYWIIKDGKKILLFHIKTQKEKFWARDFIMLLIWMSLRIYLLKQNLK